MLSISQPRSAGGAVAYYAHMEKDRMGRAGEYYASEGDHGTWIGTGATALGLDGAVSPEDFKAVCDGFHPRTGEALVRNAGHESRRAGWDLTFSAPKSVSVAWSVADPQTRNALERAHLGAVSEAFALVQKRAAYCRTGAQGRHLERAELIGAAYQHGTSREQDAQLHTHVFVMNAGLRKGGTTRCAASLASEYLYDYKMAAGATYQCQLAHELRRLGYQLERDGLETFRIASVPPRLERAHSTRRAQIEAELASSHQMGAKAAAAAALKTRRSKGRIDLAALGREWTEIARQHGYGPEQARPSLGPFPEAICTDRPNERLPMITVRHLLDSVTERDAIVTEAQILTQAFRLNIASGSSLQAQALAARAAAQAVRVEPKERQRGPRRRMEQFTTRELMKAERDVLRIAVERKDEAWHAVDGEHIVAAFQRTAAAKGYELNAEQRAAVEKLTGTAGGVQVMVGDAGTGKSSTLHAVREAHEAAGLRVIGTSAGGKASAELMASSGIESSSIAKLSSDLHGGKESLDSHTVLVIDEAGMTGSRAMARLMRAAAEGRAKVILVGDHKQLQPVGAGGTFRAIQDAIGGTRLEQIHRLHHEWERGTVKELSRGEAAAALKTYVERGRLHVDATYQRAMKNVAERHVQNMREVGAQKAIALAATNRVVDSISARVRGALKKDGQLQGAAKFTTFDKDLNSGQREIELAMGERVLIGTSDLAKGYMNGDAGQVVDMDANAGTIHVKLDRTGETVTVHPAHTELRHGYAMTTHKAQGSTYLRATVYVDRNTSRELVYVQSSRARDETHFVTTRHSVNEMRADVVPSRKLAVAVKQVAKARLTAGHEHGLQPEQLTEMRAALQYVHDNKEFATKESLAAAKDAATLAGLAEAMSRERPKETTFDYRPAVPDREDYQDHCVRLSVNAASRPPVLLEKEREKEFQDSLREVEKALTTRDQTHAPKHEQSCVDAPAPERGGFER